MNNKPTITITTDFGDGFAVSQLHAVIAKLSFDGYLVENHDVKPYSIVEGAYGIWQLAKHCPHGAVHIGVVDPGVGSKRAGIIIKTENFWFVGPDNGLLYPAANADCQDFTQNQIWHLDEKWFGRVANTFHGRDVFIKAATLLAEGKQPSEFGCKPRKKIVIFECGRNQIVHIDRYGNAKVHGGNNLRLKYLGKAVPLVKTFSEVEPQKPLLVRGSSDLLELAINLGSAEKRFGLKLGQSIKNFYE